MAETVRFRPRALAGQWERGPRITSFRRSSNHSCGAKGVCRLHSFLAPSGPLVADPKWYPCPSSFDSASVRFSVLYCVFGSLRTLFPSPGWRPGTHSPSSSGDFFDPPFDLPYRPVTEGVVESEYCTRELVIEIAADVVQREAETVAKEYARVARVPGFRPGHAPPTVVRRRYRDEIRKEVVQTLVPKFFRDAVKGQNWSVVGQPSFQDLKFEDDQPLTCKATFEVYPEFELKHYKGLEVEQEPRGVTEAAVDEAVEALRQRLATFEVVNDRAAADDDYVAVRYQGRDVKESGKPPMEVQEGLVHLAGKGTLAAFTENLRGSRAG